MRPGQECSGRALSLHLQEVFANFKSTHPFLKRQFTWGKRQKQP